VLMDLPEAMQKRSLRTSEAATAQHDAHGPWSLIEWMQYGHWVRASKAAGMVASRLPEPVVLVSVELVVLLDFFECMCLRETLCFLNCQRLVLLKTELTPAVQVRFGIALI